MREAPVALEGTVMLFGIAAVVIGGVLLISAENAGALYPAWIGYTPGVFRVGGWGVLAYGLVQLVLSALGF